SRERPFRGILDDPWRLLLARLLRHDRRADRRDLRAGPRVLLRRAEIVSDPGLPFQDDSPEPSQAPQLTAHAVLENDQRGLRSFRSDPTRTENRRLREALRVQRRK